jgi:SpoIID/LytB domain protein
MKKYINIGILSNSKINFIFNETYLFRRQHLKGKQSVSLKAGKILWNNNLYDELIFDPFDSKSSFTIKDVVIGINFHWEQKEDQRFNGILKFIIDNNNITAINILTAEDYLISVISSEMNSTSSPELLKTHAVISRSWLFAQISKKENKNEKNNNFIENENEIIRWYDKDEHKHFDVCADDHCQRYQGISRITENYEKVKQAVEATRGKVLIYENEICDARYSKCCGGITEEFQNCWENTNYPYLVKIRDNKQDTQIPDLSLDEQAINWIKDYPDSFCNTSDKTVLSQVLNNYDQETKNFYRWTVTYTIEELSALIAERSKIDFGIIQDLIPIERGTSGRIIKLKIIGSTRTMIIGKELEIRKILSKTHLYSSAFYVEKQDNIFMLHGAGWGHGVGLCQIGAAIMSEKGYEYKEILSHYYSGAEIRRLY